MLSIEEINNLKALNTELGKIIECKNGTIATLANIRDRLKENVEDLKKDLKVQNEIIGKLEAENEKLRICLEMQRTDETNQYTKKVNVERKNYKLKQTLQEIKVIATRAFAVCDDDCGNANRFTEILDLIAKAEEE